MRQPSRAWYIGLFLCLLLSGCGPSTTEINQTLVVQVAEAVPGTLAALPTATAYPTATPLPTLTAWPSYTPRPTLTPVVTATPQPTYTWQPTLTPFPTATATPTVTAAPTRAPVTPTPAVNQKEVLLLEVNRRIFYYESYVGVFYAECDQFGCDFGLKCDLVVYFYDLLTGPYTLDISGADATVQVAYEKLQTAIAQAAMGYGWANTCRTALANGTGVSTRDSGLGNPHLTPDVMAMLREAQTILEAQP